MSSTLNRCFSVQDFQAYAKRRIPFFASEYLESGTTREEALGNNLEAYRRIKLIPRFIKGNIRPQTHTHLWNFDYELPFGMAPIGMCGMVWPGAEKYMAQAACAHSIPYTLSTVACQSPEVIGPLASGDGHHTHGAWFQLYSPADWSICSHLIDRARRAHFGVLVVTVDIPTRSLRERQQRAGLVLPPRLKPRLILNALMRPAWLAAVAKHGAPRFRTVEPYVESKNVQDIVRFCGEDLRGDLDWELIQRIRDHWQGPIIIKGVLSALDAVQLKEQGFDTIWVSNHGGRQFDGVPAAVDCLPAIVEATQGTMQYLCDSGVRSGLDIVRAIYRGADMVMMGRPFAYAATTGDSSGCHQLIEILKTDLTINMAQLGCKDLADIRQVQSD